MQPLKNLTKMIVVLLAIISCKSDLKQGEVILSANIKTQMGSNHLRIYSDSTFQFEHRKLTKKTLYKGDVIINQDTLKFNYAGTIPDFGDIAVIDGIFLTYTNGIYRELLEISINTISEQTSQ